MSAITSQNSPRSSHVSIESYDGAGGIEAAWQRGLKPDPLLTVSGWADRHRMLSQRASSEPGRWRTGRTPYLREIMDCLSPSSPVERVVFMKGASDRRHRVRQQLDRLCHPSRAGADAGSPADGGHGQAKLKAAGRSVNRGKRGSVKAGQAGALTGFRQHDADQVLPRRAAGHDRRQLGGGAALHAGALFVSGRSGRLSRRPRRRRRPGGAGGSQDADVLAAQDPDRLDADHPWGVPDRARVRSVGPAPLLRALPCLPQAPVAQVRAVEVGEGQAGDRCL